MTSNEAAAQTRAMLSDEWWDNLRLMMEASEPPKPKVVCASCTSPSPPKRCSRCNYTFYCDEDCQREHWRDHKPLCYPVKKEHLMDETNKALHELVNAKLFEMYGYLRNEESDSYSLGLTRLLKAVFDIVELDPTGECGIPATQRDAIVARIKGAGEMLNRQGGSDSMRDAIHVLPRRWWGLVEAYWDGIGDWVM